MLLWRISNHASLAGEGGLLASARWHTQGHPILYLAETPAGALVEVLVHLELAPARLPRSYKLLKAEAPDGISLRTMGKTDLAQNWTQDLLATRSLGDEWLRSRATALLRVPSAIVPETFNLLLNPLHPDTALLRVLSHRDYPRGQETAGVERRISHLRNIPHFRSTHLLLDVLEKNRQHVGASGVVNSRSLWVEP